MNILKFSVCVILWAFSTSNAVAQHALGHIFDPTHAPPLSRNERIDAKALPLMLDNRRLFGPIKDQGDCGSCEVFASTGLLEAALVHDGLLFAGGEQLSEQLTLDCVALQFPNLCVNGSEAQGVLGSLNSTGTTSSRIPYPGGLGGYVNSFNRCVAEVNATTSSNFAFRASQFKKIGAVTVDDIKQAINTYGAVLASLYVTETFQSYGTFSPPIVMRPCRDQRLCGGHAVVLLGWDDGLAAFLGRNSWGAGWGQSGYFYISYGEVNRYSVSGLVTRENGIYVIQTSDLPYNYIGPPRADQKTLTVASSGDGTGSVTSSAGGISCPSKCSENYAIHATIDLTATPSANSDFAGWLGDCQSGSPVNVCRVKLDESNVVIADFVAKPTTSLDPRVVGIVGADFASRFTSAPVISTLSVTLGTTFVTEITRVDNLVIGAAYPKLVLNRFITSDGPRYDRERHRDQFALVYAKKLTVDSSLKGKEIVITHSDVVRGSLDGLNGAIGANGANGAGEVNRNGLPGQPGAQGAKGVDGTSLQYPQIVLAVERLAWSTGEDVTPGSLTIRFDFAGIGGGSGGNGGKGGHGGNGAQGKEGATNIFGCTDGPGTSGQGGDGGVGGLPGVGGDGGNGADVFAFSSLAQAPIFQGASLGLDGAVGGGGGHGGDSGDPGVGGPAAPANWPCGPGRDGPPGTKPSANLGIGATGFPGLVGSYVPYSLKQLSGVSAQEKPVVEYVDTLDFPNAPGGHFFYTNQDNELQVLDSGVVGHFLRTGNTFNSGGAKQLCRFYGSVVPGPNSHFFSIRDNECLLLQSLQIIPAPTNAQQWNYEGLVFSESPPVTDAVGTATSCGAGTMPVYRYYNNAYKGTVKNAWDSNHRYGTNKATLDAFAQTNGWAFEGIAFCARP